jgi:1,4-alpha-glucan branching enzyme
MPAKKPATKNIKETFQLEAPAASAVLLAGDFTEWNAEPIQLKKSRNGVWKATVSLPPGRYQYRFMVDGAWCDDPTAEQRIANPFGGQNCVRSVAVN